MPDTSTSPPPAKRYRYQQVKSIENLYLSPKCADVYFSLLSNRGVVLARIPAHANLLGVDSDVFEKMFYGEPKETGDIRVTDVTEAAFKEFLQFFYLSDFNISAEHIADVIHLGHKYQVKACIDACERFLKNDLTDENICTALSLGIQCGQMELVKICETRIMLNTATVLASAGFLKCNKKSLEHILKMNVLSCSEVDVFEACMSWVRAKGKQNTVTMDLVETHLEKLFYDIRFGSMTMKQFCQLSAKYNQVLSADFERITNIIVEPELTSSIFNTRPRYAEWNPNAIVHCDRSLGMAQSLFILNTTSQVIFSVNRPLLLGKITCEKICVVFKFPIRNLRAPLPVDVKITETSNLNGANPKDVLQTNAHLQSEETNISLPHPILIRPGFFYMICIGPFPDDHCYYSKELKTVVLLDDDATVKFHNCGTSNDNKVHGLVSALHFNRI